MTANPLRSALQNKQAQLLRLSGRQDHVAMNLMKAYAIIAVVCSHTGGGGVVFPMSNWAAPGGYFMQLFVFVSGFFYKPRQDEAGYFPYLKSKIRALVIPYFGWNLVYGVLNQLFRSLGVVSYGQDISLYSFFVKPWIDGHQYYFIVPAWFLLSLFLVTAIHFTLRKLLRTAGPGKEWALLMLTFLLSMASVRLSQMGYISGWPRCFLRAGFLLPYFQLGVVYRKQEAAFVRRKEPLVFVYMLLLLGIWLAAGKDGISINVIGGGYVGSPLLVTGFSVVAILLIAAVSEILVPAFAGNRLVHAIGRNTYSIMMHHGFVVFCINFCLYLLRVPGFDTEQFRKVLWYTYSWEEPRLRILYLAACIAIPVLLKHITDALLLKIPPKKE